jgi:hypothetical protein
MGRVDQPTDQPVDQPVDRVDGAARSGLRLGFMQGEYNSIRAELVAALSTQQTVMTYGLAAMAVMFTGLLSTWPNLAIRIGILSLAPLILVFIWFVWFGEALRLIRARWFIWELEQRINAELREPDGPAHDTLNWESWVRGRNRWGRNLHSRPAYHLATGILCGSGLVSTVLALAFAFATRPAPAGLRVLAVCAAAVVCGLLVVSAVTTLRNPLLRTPHNSPLPN